MTFRREDLERGFEPGSCFYAQIGVPEVWRYAGGRLEILRLERTGYAAVPTSATLPSLTSLVLSDLVGKRKTTKRSRA